MTKQQVFVSHNPNLESAQSLVFYLENYLTERGFGTFVDRQRRSDIKGIKEVGDQITHSDFFVALLSAKETDLEELKFACEAREDLDKPEILLVWLNHEGLLPYELEKWLGQSPSILWTKVDDNAYVANALLQVIINGRFPEPKHLVPLREMIVKIFDLSELRDLCFQLGYDYDELSGEGKSHKARELIFYFNRSGRLAELIDKIALLRPRIDVASIIPSHANALSQQKVAEKSINGRPLHQPAPAFDPRSIIESPSGWVDLESPFYIERVTDFQLKRLLDQNKFITTIRAPRQMGKTSLLMRGIDYGRRQGHTILFFDFQQIAKSNLKSLDDFLHTFAISIADELRLDLDVVSQSWDARRPSKQSLTYFIEDHILSKATARTILAIDEADRLLEAPFYKEFFSLIRSWDGRRGRYPLWKKLNVVMVISTQPYLLIKDINHSPFNVSEKLILTDFSPAQVQDLNQRHGSPLNQTELVAMNAYLSGHPYLTRQALYTIIDKEMRWGELAKLAASHASPFDAHLRQYLWLLGKNPNLTKAVKDIVAKQAHHEEDNLYRLEAAGLIKEIGGRRWHFRCQLYRDCFQQRL